MSLILNTFEGLMQLYRKYDDLLDREIESLTINNVDHYKEIVKEKIDLLDELTSFERERLVAFGDQSLFSLLKEELHTHDRVVVLEKLILSIQEKTETTKVLSKQISAYNKALIEAIKKGSNQGTTYGNNKLQSSLEQGVKLINRSI